MKFKFLKTVILGLVFSANSLVSTANAGLIIDNGSFTTVNELDWLDLTATQGLSVSQALANNSGWELATKTQFYNMYYEFFNFKNDEVLGVNSSVDWIHVAGGEKLTLEEGSDYASNSFSEFFGITASGSYSDYLYSYSLGKYLADSGDYVTGGVYVKDYFDRSDTLQTSMKQSVWWDDDNPTGNEGKSFGTYLVRSATDATEVPEPSTLAIFALAMIGLASRRINKKSL